MCYKPLHIFNPSHRTPSIGGALRLVVPCGKCEDCKDAKKSSYFVRTFAEYQRLEEKVNNGEAVVYFDTLTYNNKNLPIWHGIQVFNHKHIQLFLKRLRKALNKKGYPVDGNLKYFICSEFGDNTKRPHYHILLFCDFYIDAYTIWRTIRDTWTYGFNDRFQSVVIDGKKCLGAADRFVNRQGALKYVSGYVVKDSTYMEIFNQKLHDLESKGIIVDDKTKRSLQPRFFLSREFGLSFIDDKQLEYHFDEDYYIKTGKVTIKDECMIKRDFTLPLYYRQKLYFNLKEEVVKQHEDYVVEKTGEFIDGSIVRDSNGCATYYTKGKNKGKVRRHVRYYWEPNQSYIDYQLKSSRYIVERKAKKYYELFENIDSLRTADNGQCLREYISDLLGQRTFFDLALYSQIYRNKLCLCDNLYTDYNGYLQNFYTSKFIELKHGCNPKEDRDEMSRLECRLYQHIINQESCEKFHYFDEILDILDNEWNLSLEHQALLKKAKRDQQLKYKKLRDFQTYC